MRDGALYAAISYNVDDDTLRIGRLCYPVATAEQRLALLYKLEVIGYVAPAVRDHAAQAVLIAHEMSVVAGRAQEIINEAGEK